MRETGGKVGLQRNLEILVWEGGSAWRGEVVVVVQCWTWGCCPESK